VQRLDHSEQRDHGAKLSPFFDGLLISVVGAASLMSWKSRCERKRLIRRYKVNSLLPRFN
jgi:hypothetical protein